MSTFAPVLAVLAAYLVGSLSFAVILSRAFGLADPRGYGSGNPGATNVLRSGRRSAALATLALDVAKGFVPVLLAARAGYFGEGTVAAVGVAAFCGHLWPAFFGFKGGKGVATAAGVLMALDPVLGLTTLATWAVLLAFFRIVSLASIVAAVFAPFWELLMHGGGPVSAAALAMGLLLVWRHRPNIDRLLRGTESRLGGAPGAAVPGPRDAPPAEGARRPSSSRRDGASR